MKLMRGDIADVLRVARSRIQVVFLRRGASASEAILGLNILPSRKPKNPAPRALAELLRAQAARPDSSLRRAMSTRRVSRVDLSDALEPAADAPGSPVGTPVSSLARAPHAGSPRGDEPSWADGALSPARPYVADKTAMFREMERSTAGFCSQVRPLPLQPPRNPPAAPPPGPRAPQRELCAGSAALALASAEALRKILRESRRARGARAALARRVQRRPRCVLPRPSASCRPTRVLCTLRFTRSPAAARAGDESTFPLLSPSMSALPSAASTPAGEQAAPLGSIVTPGSLFGVTLKTTGVLPPPSLPY
jgi:hypothetical protein